MREIPMQRDGSKGAKELQDGYDTVEAMAEAIGRVSIHLRCVGFVGLTCAPACERPVASEVLNDIDATRGTKKMKT